MKIFKKICSPCVISFFLVFFGMQYENESLSVEATENYKIYLAAKQAYEAHEHEALTDVSSFLPKELLDQNGKPKYPLEMSEDGTCLTCELKMPPGTTPSVSNYLFPPFSPFNIIVCDLNNQTDQ